MWQSKELPYTWSGLNRMERGLPVKRLSDFLGAEELQPDAKKTIANPELRLGDVVR